MSSRARPCPIWESPPSVHEIGRSPLFCPSPRAGGRFLLDRTGVPLLQKECLSDRRRANLSYWIYHHNLQYQLFDEFSDRDPLVLNREWVKSKRDRIPSTSDRMVTFLRELIRCDDADQQPLDALLMAAGGCRNDGDLAELRRHAVEQGWTGSRDPNLAGTISSNRINLPARMHVEEQLRDVGSGRNGFVAMWFDDYMKQVYDDAIGPAICAAGYEPVLIDRREFLGDIPDEILAQIRQSRFVVADFTCCKQCTACETCKKKRRQIGAPGGVYYEAGFARGLDIPVIHTVRADCMDAVHFDTSSINHITWESPEDLQEKLHRRIEASLGRGRRDPSTEGS